MENSEHLENTENTENKKENVVVDKEEIISLKENENKDLTKEGKTKKKKSKKISLQKLKLGTKPINISLSNNIVDLNYITYFIRSRFRMILTIVIGIIILITLLILKGIFNSQDDEEKDIIIENKDVQNQNLAPNPSPPQVETFKKKKKKKKKSRRDDN